MIINDTFLNELSKSAVNSSRLRMNKDMRTTPADNSQRNINALEPGTIVPIHRHRQSSESCIVIRGSLISIFYDDNGNVTQEIKIQPQKGVYGINIPAGQWHTVKILEPNTIIFEAKDGEYEPLSSSDILLTPR